MRAAQGRIDILVANAAVLLIKPLEAHDMADWYGVLDTKLTSAFVAARFVAPHMVAQDHGRIIFISAIGPRAGRGVNPADTAAQAGLNGLARTLAVSHGPHGVTCNTIAPGYIHTDITRPFREDPEIDAWVRERTPVGRWGEPREIVWAVRYLASEAGAFVNGHILYVDGGITASL